ncbi:MAG: TatD family hydrolase [Patescibacteria group bacterium]|nr:TatD family hydrolase [Patescibacteria group bacterium]MDE2226958.1 TatD family hydrolase [Patescibacteria group bacterium]
MPVVPRFMDVHTHPQMLAYNSDREAVLGRAKIAGVKMIAVGTQFSTSHAAIELAGKYPKDVWATVGFHPAHFSVNWYHDKNEQSSPEREIFDIVALEDLAKNPKVVAIGECGLDYFRDKDEGTKDRQKEGFVAQISLAHRLKKPLMIHCRAAFPDLIQILKSKPEILNSPPGIIHFFSGTIDEAKKLLDMGFYFTFGGVITFARDYDYVIKMIPIDRILSETDAPYVSPVPYRGKRNEPAYVVEVVRKLADLKGVSIEETSETIFRNAQNVFGLIKS